MSEDYRTIPLTKGKEAKVDSEDYDRLSKHKWYTHTSGKNEYARRCGPDGRFYMHREILGAPEGMQVDHINHDGLDNRKCNLRIATPSQNMCNQKSGRGQSRFKGVSRTESGRWASEIWVNSKKHYLGRYDTEEDAARAYNRVAEKYHGEFAKLNEVGEG